MKKRLLLAFAALATAMTGFAHEKESLVYTNNARYQITGDNLCTNGTFATGFDGWTAITAEGTDITSLFSVSDELSVTSLKNAATEGMYYKFTPAQSGSSYIVSFKIRQQTLDYPYCTNAEYTLKDEGNVYGAAANMANKEGLNDINLVGTEAGKEYKTNSQFVSCGYGFTLTPDWQTVNFAIVGDGISRDYYLMFAGMNTTVEIADVQIQEAVQVADLRQRDAALNYVNTFINAFEGLEIDALTELTAGLNAITETSTQGELDALTADVNDVVGGFIEDNGVEDYIASCATNTNWMGWHKDTRGITTQMGDWRFDKSSPDGRWRDWNGFNCNDALNSPAYGYGNGGRGTQEMYMTKTLKKGTYVFAFDGAQYSCYNGNGHYVWMFGLETGAMDMTLTNVATEEVVAQSIITPLPAARIIDGMNNNFKTNTLYYNVPEDGEYTFTIKFTDNLPEGMTTVRGGSFVVQTPRIYCKLDGYSAAETAYYDNVMAQINAGRGKITEATEKLANTDLYWGKTALQEAIDTYSPVIAEYEAMDQAAIIATYTYEYVAGPTNEGALLEHEVYANATQQLIDAVRTFDNQNAELAKVATAIKNAETIFNERIYSKATGKAELTAAISAAKATDAALKADAYSEDNVAAIAEAVKTLNDAVATFKTTIPAEAITTIVDIDFDTPAVENPELAGSYIINGAKGAMEIATGFVTVSPETDSKGIGNMNFEQGIDANGVKEDAGVLRVGNGDASVLFTADCTKEDVLHVSCDWWYVQLNDSWSGFYLRNENGENVSGINLRSMNADADYNPCNVTIGGFVRYNKIGDRGSLTDDNKTHMDFYLDYGTNKMYAATSSDSGQQLTEKVDFDGSAITAFILHSNTKLSGGKSYPARRSWFDNLKIEVIKAGEVTDGITNVAGPVAAPALNARYNAAGQQVSKSYKGLVITKAGKFIQK